MKSKYLLLIPIIFFAVRASALVEITEIMYDHEGTDTKKEWVEVYNNSDSAIDLSTYKLREAETNHAIKMYGSASIIPAKGYAIIADSPADIESELAGALIFDSSFSLSNSGEELAVIGLGGDVEDSVFYDVTLGAKGDGKSLQKIDGAWVPAIPTPGAVNGSGGDAMVVETSEIVAEDESKVTEPKASGSGSKPKPTVFYLEVTIPKAIFVGENVAFKARTFDDKDNELIYSQYNWSFGDGASAQTSNPVHVYNSVGDYIVYTEAKSGIYAETNKQRIHVYEKPFSISSVSGDIIVIKNNSSSELDIGGWSLMSRGALFTFPMNTFVLPKGELRVSEKIAGLVFDAMTVLASPAGGLISSQEPTVNQVDKVTTGGSFGTEVNHSTISQKKTAESQEKPLETALKASVTDSGAERGTWLWISIFGAVLAFGLALLYFLQKRHNLIDEIEIVE